MKKDECLEAEASTLFQEAAAIQMDLSLRDRTAFVEALLNPAAPNDRLIKAADRYRQMFISRGR